MMLAEHEVVVLIQDMAQDGLRRGDVGAIVHCHAGNAAYEVEFLDERGKTKCVTTVLESQVMRLNLLSLSA